MAPKSKKPIKGWKVGIAAVLVIAISLLAIYVAPGPQIHSMIWPAENKTITSNTLPAITGTELVPMIMSGKTFNVPKDQVPDNFVQVKNGTWVAPAGAAETTTQTGELVDMIVGDKKIKVTKDQVPDNYVALKNGTWVENVAAESSEAGTVQRTGTKAVDTWMDVPVTLIESHSVGDWQDVYNTPKEISWDGTKYVYVMMGSRNDEVGIAPFQSLSDLFGQMIEDGMKSDDLEKWLPSRLSQAIRSNDLMAYQKTDTNGDVYDDYVIRAKSPDTKNQFWRVNTNLDGALRMNDGKALDEVTIKTSSKSSNDQSSSQSKVVDTEVATRPPADQTTTETVAKKPLYTSQT